MARYDQSALGANVSTAILQKTDPAVAWDDQKDSDTTSIDAQSDMELDPFWDAQSNPDSDMEDETFWDAMTNVNGDTDDQTEQGTNEAVIIQPAPANTRNEIWNELDNIKFIDIQSEPNKINHWTVMSNSKAIKEINTEKKKAESKSNTIGGTNEPQKRQIAVLYDDDDSSSRQSDRQEHKKDNKVLENVEK